MLLISGATNGQYSALETSYKIPSIRNHGSHMVVVLHAHAAKGLDVSDVSCNAYEPVDCQLSETWSGAERVGMTNVLRIHNVPVLTCQIVEAMFQFAKVRVAIDDSIGQRPAAADAYHCTELNGDDQPEVARNT